MTHSEILSKMKAIQTSIFDLEMQYKPFSNTRSKLFRARQAVEDAKHDLLVEMGIR